MNIVIILTISISIFILLLITILYNKFIKNKNKTIEAWSSIEIQLKRRYNLIPNLLSTVRAIAKHEEEIFEIIAKNREKSIQAQGAEDQAKSENKLNSSLHQLLSLAQKYPELQANKNFLDFQDTLEELEKQIQLARRYYNAVVRDTNTAIETFPGVLIANFFNFKPFQYFEMDNYYDESKNINIKFEK